MRLGGKVLDLCGLWEFLPEDCEPDALPTTFPQTLAVPGLWEAQGHLDLDGAAWYRTRFVVDDAGGYRTLRFGAVMDTAEVFLNGVPLGAHDGAYTPFELPVGGALVTGENVLAVRVVDHRLNSREHLRRAHGKQGWMNSVFPSPPSLYATYGGIWQPVALRRHGPVAVADFVVSSDPAHVEAAVSLHNHADSEQSAEVAFELFDRTVVRSVLVPARGAATVAVDIGAVDAPVWSPADPVRHAATVQIRVEGEPSDDAALMVGLRTFTVEGARFALNGEPIFLQAALVQGFRHDVLYAEGSDQQIRDEVAAAKRLGLNMLRLHIKAFDPRYLEICDELGMLVHADIPIAEPIAHDELGSSGELADAALRAVREQVRRDRSHPSLVLWSLMNEIGVERASARGTRRYAAFTQALYAAASELDPHRPIIENDWIDPDPDRVFCSPVLTAHWYGRLSARYLGELAGRVERYAGRGRPLYVSEFGDWGLPSPEPVSDATWWGPHEVHAAIARLPWTGSVAEFAAGTQRYQGLSDRLQGEVVRSGGAAGWCLTELTDVPQEYNGLWSLTRVEKAAAATEIDRLCRPVLPIVRRDSWTVVAGESVALPLVVCNDGPTIRSAGLNVVLGDAVLRRADLELPAATTTPVEGLAVRAPAAPGDYSLELSLSGPDATIGDNSYPLRVIARPSLAGVRARVIGGRKVRAALRQLGADLAAEDEAGTPVVVGEGVLGRSAAAQVRARLEAGDHVVLLAQRPKAARYLPVPASAAALATEWGSTPFLFTTAEVACDALAPTRVLTTELLSAVPSAVWTELAGRPWAEHTAVGVFKPFPGQITGTVLGWLTVGSGTLSLCQFPLCAAVLAGDAAAAALLSAVVRGEV
jgi:hypothetical protein